MFNSTNMFSKANIKTGRFNLDQTFLSNDSKIGTKHFPERHLHGTSNIWYLSKRQNANKKDIVVLCVFPRLAISNIYISILYLDLKTFRELHENNITLTLVHWQWICCLKHYCFVSWNPYQIATPFMIQVHFALKLRFQYKECFWI